MLNQRLKALAFLPLAGFLGGLIVASGPTQWLSPPVPGSTSAEAQSGHASRPAPGGTGGGRHGGMDQGGDEAAAASDAAQNGGSAAAADDRDGPEDGREDVAAAAPPPAAQGGNQRFVMLSGEQAIAFLVGNTVRMKMPDGGRLDRYHSARGWRGDQDASGLVAHRWIVKGHRLCVVGGGEAMTCSVVSIRTEARPGDEPGAVLATVSFGDGWVWPVLRGNVAGMPEHLPLIEAGLAPVHDSAPKLATAAGQDAVKALVERDLVAHDPNGLDGFYYEADGRLIEARPLAPGASSGAAGLKVSVGAWTFATDALCLDRPGLELTRRCFRPEQWGAARFRLVPDTEGPARTLLVLADRQSP